MKLLLAALALWTASASAAPLQVVVPKLRAVVPVKGWAPAAVYGAGQASARKLAVGPLHLAPEIPHPTSAPDVRQETPLEVLRLTAQEKVSAERVFDGSGGAVLAAVPAVSGKPAVRSRYEDGYWSRQSYFPRTPLRGTPAPKGAVSGGLSPEDALALLPLTLASLGTTYTLIAMSYDWIAPETALLLFALFGSLAAVPPAK